MNKLITYAVTFVVGGGISALISHIATREKMYKELQERINDMHAYYEEVYGHVDIPEEILEVNGKKEDKVDDVIKSTRSQDPLVQARSIETYTDYTQYYASKVDPAEMESPPEDTEAENLEAQGEILSNEYRLEKLANAGRLPKIIKMEECGTDPLYKTVYLTYCTVDGVLVEDQGDVYYEPEDTDAINDLVGDALDKYGFRNSDEGIICVRNFKYGTDYEITKYEGVYTDLVGEGV